MPATNALRTHNTAHAGRATPSARVIPLNPPKRSVRRVRRGERLIGMGDPFTVLHVVRVGFLKSFTISDDGLSQVTGFLMSGDVAGLDGIDTGHHQSEVVALEDSELFVLPFAQCERWTRESVHGQRLMMRTLAREIARSQELMILLGTMRAEQRIATFLLDVAERYGRLGYSRTQFVLRMTRQDIGSYLGLKLETVSRALSRLHQDGFIQVQGKSIALLDIRSLWRLSGVSPDRPKAVTEPILDHDGELVLG